MSDDLELFAPESVAMPSPKLAWMAKHGVITYCSNIAPRVWYAGFQHWWPDLRGMDFFVEETGSNGDTRVGEGPTEDDAIAHLLSCLEAHSKGIHLWNEEAP